VFSNPYGAPEHRKPRAERPQERRGRGAKRRGYCAIRGVLSLVSLTRAIRGAGPAGALCAPNFAPGKIVFARAKKETRPRCGEPQLGFEIARKARETLDSRGSATHK